MSTKSIALDAAYATIDRLREQLATAEADAERLANVLADLLIRWSEPLHDLAGEALAAHRVAVEGRTP